VPLKKLIFNYLGKLNGIIVILHTVSLNSAVGQGGVTSPIFSVEIFQIFASLGSLQILLLFVMLVALQLVLLLVPKILSFVVHKVRVITY